MFKIFIKYKNIFCRLPQYYTRFILVVFLSAIIACNYDNRSTPLSPASERIQPPSPKQARVNLELIQQNAKNIPQSGQDLPALGSTDTSGRAIVEVHVFGDFLCPHCFHNSQEMQALLKRWPGRIKVYPRYLPLDGACNFLTRHSNPAFAAARCDAARASACAAGQGQSIFNNFYHDVYGLLPQKKIPDLATLEKILTKHGGNWTTMQTCMQNQGQTRIDNDLKVIRGMLLQGQIESIFTPIVIINGKFQGSGAPSRQVLFEWVDSLIVARSGQPALDDFYRRFPHP